jgi:hypothetical protein
MRQPRRRYDQDAGQESVTKAPLDSAPVDVANNAAKLALTGIPKGYTVKITGEADRIEMYIGTDPSSDASWAILANHSYLLTITTGFLNDGDSIEGISTNETVAFSAWVNKSDTFTVQSEEEGFSLKEALTVDGRPITNITAPALFGIFADRLAVLPGADQYEIKVPDPSFADPRGSIEIEIDGL